MSGNSDGAQRMANMDDNNGDGASRSPMSSAPASPLSPPRDFNLPSTPDKFLSVPGGRSRGNSIEQSSDGGDTLVPERSGTSTRGGHDEEEEDLLKPDPSNEHEFYVEDNVFAFNPGQLGRLINPKNMGVLKALGGLPGLEKGLRTNRKEGLSIEETKLEGAVSFQDATGQLGQEYPKPESPPPPERSATALFAINNKVHSDSFEDRLRVFRNNRLPEKKAKSLLQLMWVALMDKVLLLLSAAAVISLALGLYQTFGVKRKPGEPPSVEWVEGVAIIVAIVIVVVVGAGNDWQKERQFVKLNKKKEDREVKVIRSGKSIQISVYDLLVGDVAHLEPGDLIPADGIYISGHNLKCDESSATGESDQMKKTAAEDAMAEYESNGPNAHKVDPFILSGGKVLEGIGTYMITSVGIHSAHGKTMMALREESTATPLQMKLNDLAEAIAKMGGSAALLLFVVLFIRFLAQLKGNHEPASEKAQNFMQILITAITVVVVAVPEGLPLAVTLALAFATTRMLKDNNLVRVLQSCETMGNATTICSDKTGTLTQNAMTVVAGTLGPHLRFGHKGGDSENDEGAALPMTELSTTISSDLKALLVSSIAMNSTAFEGEENGKPTFIGSKTDTAMLNFAKDYLGMGPVAEARESETVVQFIPFDSARKCMGCVIKMQNGQYRLLIKGASEILLAHANQILEVDSASLTATKLGPEIEKNLTETINTYATRSLRTIGLVYRDFQQWPPAGVRTQADDKAQAEFEDLFNDMIWLGLVGIQDPLRAGVAEAVAECQKAGVFVRMVTGDNLITAKAIAEECGIYTSGGVVMEGPKFRHLSKAQMDQVIPRLQVLARSSPEDKRILVRRLKELGETVAVTGDGTNDGPALKMADVGFSMGIAGTEVAKEASSIILMDDNFSSIVKALMWGRAVNDSVKKFLQFQLTVNITAVLLTFVTAVSSNEEESVLSAVQLLWVNLIMDTFAALALATDPPSRSVLDRKPDPKSANLITLVMWKMIIGQAIFQLIVTFVLYFAGDTLLPQYKAVDDNDRRMQTLIFNTFVWMQIFNQLNNRRLDSKFNVFEGVLRNWFFMGIFLVMIGGQVMIVFVGGRAFSVQPIDGKLWGLSVGLGALSLPIAIVIRLIPDAFVRKLVPSWFSRKKTDPVYVSNEDRFQWNQGIEQVREELSFLKLVRGGRLNQLKFSRQDIGQSIKENFSHIFRSGSKSEHVQTPTGEYPEGSHPPPSPGSHRRRRSRSNSAFAAAAMVPSIVAGSIGGWSPVEKPQSRDEGAPVLAGRADLEAQPGVSVHPDTSADDPVVPSAPPPEGSAPSQKPELAPDSQKI